MEGRVIMVIRGPLTNGEGLPSSFKSHKSDWLSDLLGKQKLDITDRLEARPRRSEQTENVLFIEEASGHTMKWMCGVINFFPQLNVNGGKRKVVSPANAVRMCKCALQVEADLQLVGDMWKPIIQPELRVVFYCYENWISLWSGRIDLSRFEAGFYVLKTLKGVDGNDLCVTGEYYFAARLWKDFSM